LQAGTPPKALLVMSFHRPFFLISLPFKTMVLIDSPLVMSATSKVTLSSGRILRN